jgi:hypothetical protein
MISVVESVTDGQLSSPISGSRNFRVSQSSANFAKPQNPFSHRRRHFYDCFSCRITVHTEGADIISISFSLSLSLSLFSNSKLNIPPFQSLPSFFRSRAMQTRKRFSLLSFSNA